MINTQLATLRGSNAPEETDLVDLGALLGTLWRAKWIIALVSVIAVLIGGYYAFKLATPLYRSTSVIILETQKQKVVDIQSVVGGISSDATSLNSEIQVLQSLGLLGKTVDALDLTKDPEFNAALRPPALRARVRSLLLGSPNLGLTSEELAERTRIKTINALKSKLRVRNIPASVVFEIVVETENAKKSALIADTIAETYIVNQLEVKFEATQQATSWLTDRVAELQIELEAAEARVSQFSTGTELVSVESLQAQERQLKDMRERVDSEQDSLTANLDRQARLTAAEDSSRAEKSQIANDQQLRSFLARLENSGDDNFAQAFDIRFDQIVARAELDVTRTRQQLSVLQASIVKIEAQLEDQNEDRIELQQLTREAEASRLLYEYFLGRLKETSAQQGIQQADSRVLSHATVSGRPSAPKKVQILGVAGFLGFALGCAVVLLMEMRKSQFRTARELEHYTNTTVMGQLPLIPAKRRRDALEYLAEKPTSAAAEAVRNLRTSVVLSDVDKTPEVIMVTSSIPGEGKTTVSLALAQNFVGLGKKVLLIEGDIRRRVFSQYLETSQAQGLLALLSGEAQVQDVVLHDDRIGADILIGEPTNTNAADIFSSNNFNSLIEEMRDAYDVIVIDTPPVLVVPDARVIAQVCDAILFTVKWDSTAKTQVEEALHMFTTVGQRVTGLVLNQIDPVGMKRYGYGGKYGAYAAYGKKYYTN